MTLTGMFAPLLSLSSEKRLTTTGPALLNGDELARAASGALGTDMKFEDISEYVASVTLNPPLRLGLTETDMKPRRSSGARRIPTIVRFSSYLNTIRSSVRARRTMLPRRHSAMSLRMSPSSHQISSGLILRSLSRRRGPRGGR
jgi:hypothetical protein